MSLLLVLGALAFLMAVAYRGHSVILLAPVAALVPVLLTDPASVAPVFTGLFMEKMVGFLKLYFPVFLLGAVFGKVIELSGFSKAIAAAVVRLVGAERAMLAVVAVCGVLTYGGVSLFVAVFAVYPFAAEVFRRGNIPRRLIPGTIALGAFTFTMDALPGTPQIQNIIPTAFFGTTLYAAPRLGTVGSAVILVCGLTYLGWLRRRALAASEGHGFDLMAETGAEGPERLPPLVLAVLPLILVGVVNSLLTTAIPWAYGASHSFVPTAVGKAAPVTQEVSKVAAVWAVEGALLVGALSACLLAWRPVTRGFAEASRPAVAGALLASMNTASEYGFGAVIASLPGFALIAEALKSVPDPLVNEAVTVSTLAGITGSASGGLSIALAAMADVFLQNARSAGIPPDVLHRVAAMASGGMDTLPHNGAVITLLAVTGLTHREAYGPIFAITLIKTVTVFVVVALYQLTGMV